MRSVWQNPKRMIQVMSTAVLGLVLPGLAAAQGDGKAGRTEFEVVSIKPTPEGPMVMMGVMDTPDGVHGENVTLPMLVRIAYGFERFPTDDRVAGAPEWKDQKFNIEAKMSAADIAATAGMTKEEKEARRERMLQAMLAERFKLKAHFASKEVATYDLVRAKGGTKLKETATAQDNFDGAKGRDGKPVPGSWISFRMNEVVGQQYSMSGLAAFLSEPAAGIGRPVIDKTGLTGKYNFTLHWRFPGLHVNGAPAPPGDGPSIFTVLQDDLGLKLDPSRGRVETIVIDHVERPSAD